MLGFLQAHERCNIQTTGPPQLLGGESLDGQVMSSLGLFLVSGDSRSWGDWFSIALVGWSDCPSNLGLSIV